ncbi:hypothetical protein GPB2148_2600 [marine gamma proteobacterium HTCC2148]|nr:hypothetical protein GPB2148_2600 [marine gamma proteobacterium HTCC2148]
MTVGTNPNVAKMFAAVERGMIQREKTCIGCQEGLAHPDA